MAYANSSLGDRGTIWQRMADRRFRQARLYPAHDCCGGFFAVRLDYEFIAGQVIALTAGLSNCRPDLAQHFVTRRMTQVVVDPFEGIDID
jgi:hypothetical protein